MDKKGQSQFMIVLATLLTLGVLFIAGFLIFGQQRPTAIISQPTAPGGTGVEQPILCGDATVTATIGQAYNQFNGSTVASIENATVFVEGAEQSAKGIGTTLSVKPGSVLGPLFYGDSTSTLYYTYKGNVPKVPCGPFYTGSPSYAEHIGTLPGGVTPAGQLMAIHDTAPTVDFLNDEDNQVNANGSAAEDIGSGLTGGVTVRIKVAEDKTLAPGAWADNFDGQAGFIATTEVNKTNMNEQSFEADSITGDWAEKKKTSAPTLWDTTFGVDSAVIAYEFTIKGAPTDSWDTRRWHYKIPADSGRNLADPNDDINFTVYVKDWCKDAATGQWIYAVEDSRGNLCGQTPFGDMIQIG